MDLGYLNSRIRAWMGELLTEEIYTALVNAEDMDALINRLRETDYARDIEIAMSRFKEGREVVEGGLKGNLMRGLRRLWEDAPLPARPLLKAIFSIWEVYNLKTILRAREKGIHPAESISILLPAGEMDESALAELNQQPDITDILNLLSTWGSPYAGPLKGVIKQYKSERHLLTLELALDRFVHNFCLSISAENGINGGIIRGLVRKRIDSINISTLVKFSGEGMAPSDMNPFFSEGGERIDRDTFLKLSVCKDRAELLKGLRDSIKDGRWKRVIGSAEPGDAFLLEERFEDLIKEDMCRLSIIEPLSISLAICFIYRKIREVKNLRLIARGKVFHIPAFELKRFMLV